ncbi:MAG: restriction endonuclease subunit S [Planctomycetota bacterium]|nr:MAG: restriction endonuclease subunit S [Planctomycetota bacterium]
MLNKLPPNWHLKKVDDVANIYLGLTYTPTYTESGIPFLSVKDLNDTYLDFEKSKFISYEEYKNATENAKPKKGDIIFGRVGTLGNPLIIETDIEFCIFVSLGFFRIRDNSCEPNFLASWMKSPLFHKQVDNIVAGGAQKNLNTGWLKNFVIPIPPLPEQKAIAQVLSTADAAIHTTEKLIAQKELFKKWLMQQLLTGKKRLKGFDREWKEKKLSDLFDRVTRKNTEGNTTVVTISAQRGFVRQTDFFNKNIASEITDNYFLVERGEFCYNKSYSNGYPWGATKRLNDFDKAVVTTLYICFGVKDENKTNPQYFEQYFGANHLDKGLTKIAHEGGRAHGLLNVTPSDFFSLKVTVPSFEEQTAIAQVLQAADKEISILKAKAVKLREQKKGLMQQLLTGKVRIKIK